jgi:hypothetical protein
MYRRISGAKELVACDNSAFHDDLLSAWGFD